MPVTPGPAWHATKASLSARHINSIKVHSSLGWDWTIIRDSQCGLTLAAASGLGWSTQRRASLSCSSTVSAFRGEWLKEWRTRSSRRGWSWRHVAFFFFSFTEAFLSSWYPDLDSAVGFSIPCLLLKPAVLCEPTRGEKPRWTDRQTEIVVGASVRRAVRCCGYPRRAYEIDLHCTQVELGGSCWQREFRLSPVPKASVLPSPCSERCALHQDQTLRYGSEEFQSRELISERAGEIGRHSFRELPEWVPAPLARMNSWRRIISFHSRNMSVVLKSFW
jgi:hypothetical protein